MFSFLILLREQHLHFIDVVLKSLVACCRTSLICLSIPTSSFSHPTFYRYNSKNGTLLTCNKYCLKIKHKFTSCRSTEPENYEPQSWSLLQYHRENTKVIMISQEINFTTWQKAETNNNSYAWAFLSIIKNSFINANSSKFLGRGKRYVKVYYEWGFSNFNYAPEIFGICLFGWSDGWLIIWVFLQEKSWG